MNLFKKHYQEVLTTIKLIDVEETFDLYFSRYVGLVFAKIAMKLKMTPTHVSLVSLLVGVIGGGMIYYQDDTQVVFWGCILITWAGVLDSSDGQLARLTNQSSELGKYIDGLIDGLVFGSCYIAGCIYLSAEYGWPIFIAMFLAGFLHSRKSALYDFYKMEYMYYVGEFDSVRVPLNEEVKQHLNKNRMPSWIRAFTTDYIAQQHQFTSRNKELRLAFEQWRSQEEFREMYRDKIRPLMTWWALICGTNSHRTTIMFAALASMFELHLLFAILGVLPMLILERVQRKADQEILHHFKSVQHES